MAIDLITTDLTNLSSSSAPATINANFSAIEVALAKAVDRDGGSDNEMNADLDMDNNDILNVGSLNSFDISSLSSLQDAIDAAALSEYNSSESAVEALASETNAAASLDEFTDLYLGAKATDPTLDNDGDPLAAGALYLNTTDDTLRYYNGSAWGDAGSVVFRVTSAVGDGATVAYTLTAAPVSENNVQVFLDGVRQSVSTYSVSGTTLTFSSAPTNLSEIEMVYIVPASIGSASSDNVSHTDYLGGVTNAETALNTLETSAAKEFNTVALLLADTNLDYTNSSVGDVVCAGGFNYTVAATGATDEHVTTAGGLKLYNNGDDAGSNVKAFGAVGDGVTDDSAAFQAAIDNGGLINVPDGDYLVETQLVGQLYDTFHIRGSGKSSTTILFNCSGDAGLLFDGSQHCQVSDMTLQGNDTTAPILQLGDGTGITYSNLFSNIRFKGNSGGAKPAFASNLHAGVKGVESTSGGSANYFHRFINCDFDSLFAGFDAEFNANAWQISNIKFQDVWRCFRGSFQEWMGTNLFWHSTSGSGSDYAIGFEIIGKSGSELALYNTFNNISFEPGPTLTQFYSLDANTSTNFFMGDHQCTIEGTDSGSNNTLSRTNSGRYITGSTYSYRYTSHVTFGYTGGAGDVRLFGNGTTSYTGTARKLVIFGGQSAETRHGEIWQQPGGNFTLKSLVFGRLELDGYSGIKLEANTNTIELTGVSGGVTLNGNKVLDTQQSAIADSSGGDEQAKINSILAALRAHGLIAT